MSDFRILPEVADDLAEAANWYDKKGYVGLGNRFIQSFYSYIPHLQEQGKIYRVVYSDFRKILLQPFPYFLYYRYHGDLLVISLVISAVRRPSLIRRRLGNRQ
jgi:hypothetical protein